MNTQPTDRQQTISGLRELADFLDANPDVPVDPWWNNQYSVDLDVKVGDRRAEVDRIAAILGVEPVDDSHYTAKLTFGNVTYKAVSTNPGPKPGKCINHPDSPVHRRGSKLVDGQVCIDCLTPSIAAAFDVAHELTDDPADTAKES
jgi:hypothetical protein